VCDLALDGITGVLYDNFDLIYFGETEADQLGPSRAMGAIGLVGHPHNAVWFCTDHVRLGREHENMPVKEALAAISKLLGRPPRP
jgi:hypothetical protein